ncbi:unnamed protein product [Psylliodes chrysocephalus]|uniref:Uncharacterized protein n=1 Tax=Psylliodes chrysocephalus TaxID=3402493 RepID=A0A9P0CZV5_9CUCU|nr:unnamed protein product [Psylliodes chrysocephala]
MRKLPRGSSRELYAVQGVFRPNQKDEREKNSTSTTKEIHISAATSVNAWKNQRKNKFQPSEEFPPLPNNSKQAYSQKQNQNRRQPNMVNQPTDAIDDIFALNQEFVELNSMKARMGQRRAFTKLYNNLHELLFQSKPDMIQLEVNIRNFDQRFNSIKELDQQMYDHLLNISSNEDDIVTELETSEEYLTNNSPRKTPSGSKNGDKKNSALTLDDLMIVLQDMRREMRDYRKDLTYYSECFEEQKVRNGLIDEELIKLKRENETIKNEINKIKTSLEAKNNEKRKNNLIVVGIKYNVEENGTSWIENVKKKAKKAIQYVAPNIDEENCKIKLTNFKTSNSPILIEFNTMENKTTFYKNGEQKVK